MVTVGGIAVKEEGSPLPCPSAPTSCLKCLPAGPESSRHSLRLQELDTLVATPSPGGQVSLPPDIFLGCPGQSSRHNPPLRRPFFPDGPDKDKLFVQQQLRVLISPPFTAAQCLTFRGSLPSSEAPSGHELAFSFPATHPLGGLLAVLA